MSKAAEAEAKGKTQVVFCPHCGAVGRFEAGESHVAYRFSHEGCDQCQHDGPNIRTRGRGPLEAEK
jgi:hypothetical protein